LEELVVIRTLIALVVVLSLSGPTLANSGEPISIDPLTWLEGDWKRQTKRGEATETWHRVSENTMEGSAYMVSDSETQFTEYLRIETLGDEIFYTAKPVQNPYPTSFRLVTHDGNHFVFENPNHDFPQRIIYTRQSEDELLVRIEGPMDGETRSVDFRFEKAK
jgi:hypothetical protein